MDTLQLIFDWLLSSWTSIIASLSGWSWLGVCVIGLYLLRRIVNLIRKVY